MKFDVVPLEEAKVQTTRGRRAERVRELLPYIEQVKANQAGRITLEEGDKPATIKRRLNAAAKLVGKSLVVKRSGDKLYFWVVSQEEAPKRRERRVRKGSPQV